MFLNLSSFVADGYSSNSQKMRVLTEQWVDKNIFCPNCGNAIVGYENNRPVADFYCSACNEDYELKSKKDNIGTKIVDGAYSTMIERLQSDTNPNFFFLNYDINSFDVVNFVVIPKHFFVPENIEKRKPLSETARRAGWVGCNILLNTIPNSGKIFYIQNKQIQSKEHILESWNKTKFLKESTNIDAKGWLLDIIACIDKTNKTDFALQDIYNFENFLKIKHPNNNNIQAKIRQQLQILRDKDFIKFSERGKYKLI